MDTGKKFVLTLPRNTHDMIFNRDEQVKLIAEIFLSQKKNLQYAVLLGQNAGTGASFTALKYVRGENIVETHILWIDSESSLTIDNSFLDIRRRLEQNRYKLTAGATDYQLVLNWMAATGMPKFRSFI